MNTNPAVLLENAVVEVFTPPRVCSCDYQTVIWLLAKRRKSRQSAGEETKKYAKTVELEEKVHLQPGQFIVLSHRLNG